MSRTDRVVFAGTGLAAVAVAYGMAAALAVALVCNPLPPWFGLLYVGVAEGLFVALGTIAGRTVVDAWRGRL